MAKFLGVLSVPTLALAGLLACGGAPAAACDPCGYRVVTCYENVPVCEVRTVPYTCTVTLYDSCGKPYLANVTRYRQVKVEVVKRVAVRKLVALYD
jgi:hypothetical protein